ncbi:MAG TPA: antitoxin [Desulfuromonadales bacterium]|nr:antitoxin [Desulfuromonadales bacterium]
MTTMTLRCIDDTLAQGLKELARSQGISLNALALRLIREATGVDKRKRTLVHHDLDTLAGTWGKDEEAFLKTTHSLETLDEEMWN